MSVDQELVIRLARDAGFNVLGTLVATDATLERLARFAAFVAEECARVCEAERDRDVIEEYRSTMDEQAELCAEAIRARFPVGGF